MAAGNPRTTRSFAIVALALVTGGQAFAQGGMPPASVRVVDAQMLSMAPRVSVPGTVLSRDDARVATEVSGKLLTVVEVGEHVARDAILAAIKDPTFRASRDEARGLVGAEKARIVFLEKELKRLARLAAQNNAAQSLLEQTQSDLDVARSNLRMAEAKLQLAEIALFESLIRAPFAGVVTERFMQPGEHANAGEQIVRLVNDERLEVVARAPLQSVRFVAAGDTLPLQGDIHQGKGTVRTIVPFGDSRSAMFELRVDVPRGEWRIGEPVRLSVATAAPQSLLAVPRDALVLRRDGAFVYRINADMKAERIAVKPGVADGELIAVEGELVAGDRIVVRGAERLMPDQTVTILDEPDGPAAERRAGS